jgi:hypothetical protein
MFSGLQSTINVTANQAAGHSCLLPDEKHILRLSGWERRLTDQADGVGAQVSGSFPDGKEESW